MRPRTAKVLRVGDIHPMSANKMLIPPATYARLGLQAQHFNLEVGFSFFQSSPSEVLHRQWWIVADFATR